MFSLFFVKKRILGNNSRFVEELPFDQSGIVVGRRDVGVTRDNLLRQQFDHRFTSSSCDADGVL